MRWHNSPQNKDTRQRTYRNIIIKQKMLRKRLPESACLLSLKETPFTEIHNLFLGTDT